MISILIANEYSIVRNELKLILADQPDFHVVSAINWDNDTINEIRDLNPDIIIVDLYTNNPTLNIMNKIREIANSLALH